jgi:hypothetical protein
LLGVERHTPQMPSRAFLHELISFLHNATNQMGGDMSSRPRTLKYAEALQTVEQRVVDALPEIIDALIGRAKTGDLKAAVYLCDRILGRTAGARVAPADDREAPYSEAAFELDHQEREDDRGMRSFLTGFGARKGA